MVMNEFLKLFGQRLAAVRKERGWSQEQLALESGVARSYLSGRAWAAQYQPYQYLPFGRNFGREAIGIVGVLTCYWFPSSVRIEMRFTSIS